MKFRKPFTMLIVLVLLLNTALGTWMNTAAAEEVSAEEQVLVFKTFGYRPGFGDYELAEAFNKAHPGKKIIVEEVSKGEALVTELMSGKADYILNAIGTNLDGSKCAASGVFVDLYDWMDTDPDFHREDYYENIFRAMEYDGHLYGIPAYFYTPVIFLNRPIAEALGVNYEPLDSIDIVEILDLYDAAKEQGLMAEDTPLVFQDELGNSALLEMEFFAYMDMDEKTSHFSDPAFIELLERSKAVYSQRRMSAGSAMSIIPDRSAFGEAILGQNTSSLFLETTATLQPLEGGTLATPHEALMGPLVFESASGAAALAGSRLLMVPTSCSNPELAWEFIKFCIAPMDEENGEEPTTAHYKSGEIRSFPISKANLAAFAEYYKAFGDADFDTYLAKLEARIGEIRECYIYKQMAGLVVYPIQEQFYDYGTITAEECARQMDERLFLYLNE